MIASTTFLVAVTALVACKIATVINVDSGQFDHLPRPSEIE